MSILGDEGVGEDEQFSHYCSDGDFGRFTVLSEPLVEELEVGVAAGGGERGHVEGLAQMRPSTADVAQAMSIAAVAREGRETGESGDLLAVGASDHIEVGEQLGRGDRTDAGDRTDDGV